MIERAYIHRQPHELIEQAHVEAPSMIVLVGLLRRLKHTRTEIKAVNLPGVIEAEEGSRNRCAKRWNHFVESLNPHC